MTSRNTIRSWLGLSQFAEGPTNHLPIEKTISTSSPNVMSTSPSKDTANEPSIVQAEQTVLSLEVSVSDTSSERVNATKRELVTVNKEDTKATKDHRHSTPNASSVVPVKSPEDPLSTTIAPDSGDGSTPSTESSHAERSMLGSTTLNDHSPSTPQNLSQDSEESSKSSSLSIAPPPFDLPVVHADNAPKDPSLAPPSSAITCDDTKSNGPTETTIVNRVYQQNEEGSDGGQNPVVPHKLSKDTVVNQSETRALSNSSNWWWFGSSVTPSAPALQAEKAAKPPLAKFSSSDTDGKAAYISEAGGKNKDIAGETEGRLEESETVSEHNERCNNDDKPQPVPTPHSFPTSVFNLKSASDLIFGNVRFSRRGSRNRVAPENDRDREDDVVTCSKEANAVKTGNSGIVTSAIESGFDKRKHLTAASTISPSSLLRVKPSEASQTPPAPSSTKLSLPRTANFVLPQLPLPPELGISHSALLGTSTRIPQAHAGDSIVSKALGVLESMIWSKRKSQENNPENLGTINKGECQWPEEIRKVAIIGIHGWFPIKLFQRVIGEPTGTSPRFCTDMRSAILHHIQAHHPKNPQDLEITLIPLEGEGKVLDRVSILHAALRARPDWIEALRNADCVFVASHSQGAPVSTLLLSRLLNETIDVDATMEHVSKPPLNKKDAPLTSESNVKPKIIEPVAVTNGFNGEGRAANPILEAAHEDKCDSNGSNSGTTKSPHTPAHGPLLLDPRRQRIGMLAMAGISHGPFPLLKSNLIVRYLEAEAARELFEFMECPGDDGSLDSATAGFESMGGPTKRERKKRLELSRAYWKAMRDVLDKGVKVTCVASMADQVVPLYSATMHALSHPNLLRALYIDAPAAQEATSIAQTGNKQVHTPTTVEPAHPPSDPATAANFGRESSSSTTRSPAFIHQGPPSVSTSSSKAKTKASHVPSASSLVTEIPGPGDLDFLTNLIVFALRLRNAGLSDHGLIVHLSEAVAGSLYGTGHSTIYEEPEVYALAFKWLLSPNQPTQSTSNQPPHETRKRGHKVAPVSTSTASYTPSNIPPRTVQSTNHIPSTIPPFVSSATSDIPPPARSDRTPAAPVTATPPSNPPNSNFRLEHFTATANLNPFFLPWIMRALLSDPLVAAHPDLAGELQEIIRQFKNWEPRERAMRDLKYRLEPLRSHL